MSSICTTKLHHCLSLQYNWHCGNNHDVWVYMRVYHCIFLNRTFPSAVHMPQMSSALLNRDSCTQLNPVEVVCLDLVYQARSLLRPTTYLLSPHAKKGSSKSQYWLLLADLNWPMKSRFQHSCKKSKREWDTMRGWACKDSVVPSCVPYNCLNMAIISVHQHWSYINKDDLDGVIDWSMCILGYSVWSLSKRMQQETFYTERMCLWVSLRAMASQPYSKCAHLCWNAVNNWRTRYCAS